MRRGPGPAARRRPRSRCPDRLLILGGGVVGVELAQAWSSLGASVALVEAEPRILVNEEEFASEQIRESLESAGVEIRTGARATAVSRGEGGQVTLKLEDGSELHGDEILVAVGRRPRTSRARPRHRRRRGQRRGLHRGRRRDARRRLGLALRDRRRQRARAAHPHGQVPGLGLRRADPRQLDRGDRRPGRVAARCLHRAAAGGRRPDGSRPPRSRASTSAPSTSKPRPTPARASSAATRSAPRGSSSTRAAA